MNLKDYVSISETVQKAMDEGKPIVALESTILSHGMPYPENLEFAHQVEEIILAEGAVPATIALMDGKIKVGLNADELLTMCKEPGIGKVSRRDMPYYIANKKVGATTVTTTMIGAAAAGISVFATGGIGGVHRGAQETMDISADLQELAHTPVTVVSAGCKSLLDIGLTLEYLETMGVPVLGYQTEDFPAFYCRESGHKCDYRVESPEEIANIMKVKNELGLAGGMIVANPVPEEYALDFNYMEGFITKAVEMCKEQGIRGKATTPFLLATIKDLTGGESLATNIQLAFNNARVASRIAVAYNKIK